MSKLGKFVAAGVAVALGVGVVGSLNAAETAVDAIYVDCNAAAGGDGSADGPFRARNYAVGWFRARSVGVIFGHEMMDMVDFVP